MVAPAPAIDRKKGFEEVLKSTPKLQIIRSQSGEFTRAKGKEVMESFLKQRDKKIDVLYAHNDDMALGAIQAIQAAGKTPGKDAAGAKPTYPSLFGLESLRIALGRAASRSMIPTTLELEVELVEAAFGWFVERHGGLSWRRWDARYSAQSSGV